MGRESKANDTITLYFKFFSGETQSLLGFIKRLKNSLLLDFVLNFLSNGMLLHIKISLICIHLPSAIVRHMQ